MSDFVVMGLMGLCFLSFGALVWGLAGARKDAFQAAREMIDLLAAEKSDLLDRLMADSYGEYKTMQGAAETPEPEKAVYALGEEEPYEEDGSMVE
jgi:hypothetical protein